MSDVTIVRLVLSRVYTNARGKTLLCGVAYLVVECRVCDLCSRATLNFARYFIFSTQGLDVFEIST